MDENIEDLEEYVIDTRRTELRQELERIDTLTPLAKHGHISMSCPSDRKTILYLRDDTSLDEINQLVSTLSDVFPTIDRGEYKNHRRQYLVLFWDRKESFIN